MSSFCPVCKNTINEDTVKCNVCNFTDLHREFITKEDAQDWFDSVVLPYRAKLKETKNTKPKANLFGKEIKRGDILSFGKWYFDSSTSTKPIEWFVISVNKSVALLLSKYCIDYLPYNNHHGKTTWENCSLRRWLNNEFMNKAFSKNEQNALLQTNVINNQKNSSYPSFGGNDTIDKVFLLSENEARYIEYDYDVRFSLPTPYVKAKGARSYCNEGTIAWYLRTPGCDNASVAYFQGSVVPGFSAINNFGESTYGLDDYRRYCGVRPAVWIKLNNRDEHNTTDISNKYSFNMFDYDKDGYDVNGYNEKSVNREGYNINGFDEKGFNSEGYDKNGLNIHGYRKDGYDINGYDASGKKRKFSYKVKNFIHKIDEAEYVSAIIDGVIWGYGRRIYDDGIYEGEWKENIPNGYGNYKKGGTKYEGIFVSGKLSGYGRIVYNNGTYYEGSIKENLSCGYGKYTGTNNFKHIGYWENGIENGIGVVTYSNGDKFAGDFVDGKKHGQGIYVWRDGQMYEGEWEKGKRNGYGKQILSNGETKIGYWKDDKYIGK